VLHGSVNAALGVLGQQGINRLLVEGGAVTARSFWDAGMVDEVQIFRSPDCIGAGGVDALAGLELDSALQPFALREEERLGPDRLTVYEARN
jgi:diaminohydroxyphosphoribosylaminopyrimidine deaminase/5-amino-6-(5-phosphoribosylamino)uracil reductase